VDWGLYCVALTVVYLKKADKPPKGAVILDCRKQTSGAEFEKALIDLAEKGVSKVFVRGKPSA
jgi:hypothetical protein